MGVQYKPEEQTALVEVRKKDAQIKELRDLMRSLDKNKASYVDDNGRRNVVNWFNRRAISQATRYNALKIYKK